MSDKTDKAQIQLLVEANKKNCKSVCYRTRNLEEKGSRKISRASSYI